MLSLPLALGAVVDLATSLTSLLGPGEVHDREDEEGVAGVCHARESVVPVGEVWLAWRYLQTERNTK